MSQAATLYRISQVTFDELNNKQEFDADSAKGYSTFQASFMALEYILSKGKDDSTIQVVNEIFNPQKLTAQEEFESLTEEEKFEAYESGFFIPYLDNSDISKLNEIITDISETDLISLYNADELNNNGIYPEIWHNDNETEQAFNMRQISEDFEELKSIIKKAKQEQDYILVFVG
ncbi:DUF1877 family protein [Rhizosphaericola mali]|uniref:DUF1877 family protein n=1 Tax=Rhizosphaericola mali TaxID=2545455 RepID=A0A5P2G2F5_9BACT|nr:DUF1877 family protein [Rhizosphaericola mali]QES88279.1 DUF1877 family protein [Rhizosphaericola mali]